jgi:hypothetical protein
MLTTALDLLGVTLICAGCYFVAWPLALIAAGVAVLAMSYIEPWRRER